MSKKNIKIISLLVSLTIIVSLITFKNIRVNADVSDMPIFDVKIDSVDPNPALVGEDITVNGTITPQPFETTVPAKEIVLVLDVSNSMNEHIKGRTGVRRIDALKEAAKNFMDKMKTVPNLKIGIVTYGTNAEIKKSKINGVNNVLINASNSDKLKGIINNIDISGGQDGGTNTGDGLRKASYLLSHSTEANKNANKTIVLMSDGMPTYRVSNYEWKGNRYYKNELNYYTNITIEGYEAAEVFGTGNSDKDLKNTNYAIDVGKIINEKGYNVFSVGYGLSNTIDSGEKLSGLDKIKLIHASMIGANIKDNKVNDGTIINKENGFYETSEGAIDGVFQQIADKIIDSYPINNVALNIDFNDSFSLNIGGNTVNIGNVIYKKKSENGSRVRYEADPFNFSFKVKGNKEVENQPIYKKMEINYKWNDRLKSINTNTIANVTVELNELPIIQASLIGNKTININENQDFTVSYNIEPKDFSFNDETNSNKSDVVFVIDVSKDMGSYMDPLINDLWNDILNNDRLKVAKTEYDIITFSNKVEIIDLSSSSYSNYSQYITDLNDNYIKNKLKPDNSNSKNITNTYNDIIKLLDNGRAGVRKNVVFISETSNIKYGVEKDYGALKSRGYNIITVEIENLNNGNNKNDLKDFHKLLGGLSENYFYSKDQNKLQNNILAKVADRIASNSSYNDYKFTPKLQIDLGENFDLVTGGEVLDNNIASIKVPEIIYKYSKTENIYKADKTNVKVIIRPKNGKVGSLKFGSQNKLIYKKLIKDEDKYSLVETPIVIVTQQIKNVTHGLYNGIISNKTTGKKEISIQENNNGTSFEIAQDSTVTFGSKFTLSGNSVDFALNIDNKFNTVSTNDIKIYKNLKDSSGNSILTEITNGNRAIENQGDNNFKISINNIKESNQTSESDILVIYQARVKDELSMSQSLTNEIKFSNLSKSVNIITPQASDKSPSLPDLF